MNVRSVATHFAFAFVPLRDYLGTMTATTFDTLKAKEALLAVGIEDSHASAIVGIAREAVTEGVATKTDIARLEARIETDIARLEARIEAAANRNMMTAIAVGGVVIAALKLL